jgi:hypothetical protein
VPLQHQQSGCCEIIQEPFYKKPLALALGIAHGIHAQAEGKVSLRNIYFTGLVSCVRGRSINWWLVPPENEVTTLHHEKPALTDWRLEHEFAFTGRLAVIDAQVCKDVTAYAGS